MSTPYEYSYTAWVAFYTELSEKYGIPFRNRQFIPKTKDNEEQGKKCERFYKSFIELGALLYRHDIDPQDYVSVTLQLLEKNISNVTPRDIVSNKMLQQYREYRERRQDDNLFSWLTQLQDITDVLQHSDATAEQVLYDARRPFEPWFRVIYLEECTEAIYDLYGKDAYRQLQLNERLRKFARQQKPEQVAALERRYNKNLPVD